MFFIYLHVYQTPQELQLIKSIESKLKKRKKYIFFVSLTNLGPFILVMQPIMNKKLMLLLN
jgi:hypothetical protein